MNPVVSRRAFFAKSAGMLGALSLPGGLGRLSLSAVEPFPRPGPARLLTSLAAYSFRQYFKDSTDEDAGKVDAAKKIDLFRFVDYCAEQGCTGAELTSYYFPKTADAEFFVKLRRHCFLRGVEVSGTSVGNTFTHPAGKSRDEQLAYVKKWVDNAVLLGAPHIRVFAGNTPRGSTKAEAMKNCISALEECAAHAGEWGVFLGIENHGGIVAEADDLLEIVRTVKSPWVGINLDSGNFHTKDPYGDFERCAPFAVNVQLKADLQRRDGPKELADLPRFVKILRQSHYQGYVALEYESAEDPWTAVPRLLKQMKELLAT